MSVVLKGVCLLLALSTCAETVIAIAPCNQTIVDLIVKGRILTCNVQSRPPPQTISNGFNRSFFTYITKGDIPEDLYCATVRDWGKEAVYEVLTNDREYKKCINTREVKKDHILETDSTGAKYRIYVINGDHDVYSFYRCIHSGAGQGNGRPMAAVVVDYKVVDVLNKWYTANALMWTAARCFGELGIGDLVELRQCYGAEASMKNDDEDLLRAALYEMNGATNMHLFN